jgi:hypothetical protein
MDKKIQDAINEDTKRLDESYFAVGDVLDVKASVVLVVVTFLGALSGQILTLHDLPVAIKGLQLASVLSLCAVGLLILSCLWLKRFQLPPKPELWKQWVIELEQNLKAHDDASELVAEEFGRQREARTLERIALNSELASKKSKLLKWSFRALSLAVVLEFTCLVWLAFWHL